MENYNQSSQKDENRQSSTVPSWYSPNKPYNERNQQQFTEMEDDRTTRGASTSGGHGNAQLPGQSDRNYDDRRSQRPTQYNTPEDDLEEDELDENASDPDTLEEDGEDDEGKYSAARQSYSNRAAHHHGSLRLTF